MPRGSVPARAETDFLARLFRVYAEGDRAYYDPVMALPRALETINVFCTQPLNAWLIYAILARKPYRHALQPIVGS